MINISKKQPKEAISYESALLRQPEALVSQRARFDGIRLHHPYKVRTTLHALPTYRRKHKQVSTKLRGTTLTLEMAFSSDEVRTGASAVMVSNNFL